MSALVTPAWIMAGRLRNIPGVLTAGDGRLAFVTDDGPVFTVPFTQIGEVRWPWWWFGGGVVLIVGGERYKITFIRPNGAPPVSGALAETGAGVLALAVGGGEVYRAARGLVDMHQGRRAAAAWKQVLPA